MFWGALLAAPILLATGNVTFANVAMSDIVVMIIVQGFFIAILATFLFNYAVNTLGAAESGAFGALTPILALIGGVAFLNESLTVLKVVGVVFVAVGVFLASGVLSKPRLPDR